MHYCFVSLFYSTERNAPDIPRTAPPPQRSKYPHIQPSAHSSHRLNFLPPHKTLFRFSPRPLSYRLNEKTTLFHTNVSVSDGESVLSI